MLVECIDDTFKPNDIPLSQWIVKGREYTVIGVFKMNMQNGILGFELAEINLNGCAPYKYYAASRFKVKELQPEVAVTEKVEEEELAEVY
jgi:hypothetical protein